MHPNIKIEAKPSIVLREEFEDQAVLFDPDSGAAHGLNRVGMRTWSCLDGRHSLEDIRQELALEFEPISDDAAKQIEDFIQELLAKGLASIHADDCYNPLLHGKGL